MNDVIDIVSGVVMVIGSLLAILAAIGLLKFDTPTARFHAAGKASPVAFLVAAMGAGLSLGWAGSAALIVAVLAMILTLPTGVHLLFRAVHKDGPNDYLRIDELAEAKEAKRS